MARMTSGIGSGSNPDTRIQLNGANGLSVLVIPAFKHPKRVSWSLPPSKSHMIRWIALAAQSRSETELRFSGIPGEDICSMAHCMGKLGAKLDRKRDRWLVRGGLDGNGANRVVLDCGNSATTARVVTSIAAGLRGTFLIDGDESLRSRDSAELNAALRSLGCNITSDTMPFSISGPIHTGSATVDEAKSSQTITGLMLASPGYPEGARIRLEGEGVSRGYRELTIDICRSCGWGGSIDSRSIDIGQWEVKTPEIVEIPEEISLLPLSLLFDKLHGTKSLEVDLVNSDPWIMEAVNTAMSCNGGQVDLRDASDIIAPAAAIMALGGGGTIVGSSHARGKESDRIESTSRMLSSFGISSDERSDGLFIPGDQVPISPSKPVDCKGDHRLAMTSIVLATAVGAEVQGEQICSVTHPDFIEMLLGEKGGL